MLAFEKALDDEVSGRHFKRDDFEVLILTQSRRRAEALRQVARRVVETDRHGDYYRSTFDEVVMGSAAFATATWWSLRGETCEGVLYDE